MGTWLLMGRGGKRGRNVVLEFELLHDRQVAALGLQPDRTGGRLSQQGGMAAHNAEQQVCE